MITEDFKQTVLFTELQETMKNWANTDCNSDTCEGCMYEEILEYVEGRRQTLCDYLIALREHLKIDGDATGNDRNTLRELMLLSEFQQIAKSFVGLECTVTSCNGCGWKGKINRNGMTICQLMILINNHYK